VLAFLPWRGGWAAAPPLMSALGMVGSDLDHFACPRCGCNDRDRHLKLYIERLGLLERFRGARVLHFAPEPWLGRWIVDAMPARYVAADLYPSSPGIERIAMEQIPFEDGAFDIVIANHVFEHVGDVTQAAREVARVLAPDGLAILQTPWCRGIESSIEDPLVTSPEARLQLYGQEDHVRLFGRDVFERIGGDSLAAESISHADVMPDVDPDMAGVNPAESLMLFRPRLSAPR
jgi:SAM-dependent methyltransferase